MEKFKFLARTLNKHTLIKLYFFNHTHTNTSYFVKTLHFSAAHCFYVHGSNLNAEKIKVGIGQISPDFDKPEPGSMISNVSF